MKRNPAIELFRVILTFGICWLHAITKCGHIGSAVCGYGTYFLYSCVVGFVFISGWFGIKTTSKKMGKLWAMAGYAVLTLAAIETALNGNMGVSRYWQILIGNWFLNGYCLLMLLAPMVDIVIGCLSNKCEPKEKSAALFAMACLLVLTLGWGFLTTIPHVSKFVPKTPGVWSYSGLTLVGIYAVARLCRQFEYSKHISRPTAMVISAICIIAILSHCGAYSSPFAVGLVAMAFLPVIRMPSPEWICVFSPSMFMVFLFHANEVGFRYMGLLEDKLVYCGLSVDLAMFITAIAAFAAGLLLDVPRRMFILFVQRRCGHGQQKSVQ